MNCEKYLPLIDDLIEGELNQSNAEQVNLHIFACAQCSKYYAEQRSEKGIYAHYLFDVEPPPDLWAKFQTKIAAETDVVSPISETPTKRKINIFNFFRLYPAAAFAIALVIFGIGLMLKTTSDKIVSVNQYAAQKDSKNSLETNDSFNTKDEVSTKTLTINAESSNTIARLKSVKIDDKTISPNRKTDGERKNKFAAVKLVNKTEKTYNGAKTPNDIRADENQILQAQLTTLDNETARQIEKTEMLLRSFRNSRLVENESVYDMAYEKQQARRLLEKNVRLRQAAENYGTAYTREILDKVEPLLLDIANLENNPASGKVLDIKERVKNQNIIASLQGY